MDASSPYRDGSDGQGFALIVGENPTADNLLSGGIQRVIVMTPHNIVSKVSVKYLLALIRGACILLWRISVVTLTILRMTHTERTLRGRMFNSCH